MTNPAAPRPTQCAMDEISFVAMGEASRIVSTRPHAAWSEEASAWARLAEAAYACKCILVARHLSFVQGEPPQTEGPSCPTNGDAP